MKRHTHASRLIGSTVGGKYKLNGVLGVGGMGAVYEAQHAYTNRRVALKLLGPDYAESHEVAARFLQEAQAPSSIGHPNIIEVLDAGEDPDLGLYLVLEHLEGEDLECAIKGGRIDVPTLLGATLQLLDALSAAHAQGFVHRDIKPANVFLVKNPDGTVRAKLLDFGIARNAALSLTASNTVMGTPHYMSPEQARGLRVDPRADLWAVGAILYYAFTGTPPFEGENINLIMVAILMNPPPSLAERRPDLSPALLLLVERALQKDPDERWASAQEMAAQLVRAPELDDAHRLSATIPIDAAAALTGGSSSGRQIDAAQSGRQSDAAQSVDASAPTMFSPTSDTPSPASMPSVTIVDVPSASPRPAADASESSAGRTLAVPFLVGIITAGVLVIVAAVSAHRDAPVLPRAAAHPMARTTVEIVPLPPPPAVVEAPPPPAPPDAQDAGALAAAPRHDDRPHPASHAGHAVAAPPPGAPPQHPSRMGGLTIGNYNSP